MVRYRIKKNKYKENGMHLKTTLDSLQNFKSFALIFDIWFIKEFASYHSTHCSAQSAKIYRSNKTNKTIALYPIKGLSSLPGCNEI